MKVQCFFIGALLGAHAALIPVLYFCEYPGSNVSRYGTIQDHKVSALVNGLSRWSDGRFEAYEGGAGAVVVKTIRAAPDAATARRLLGEMYSLVARFAADR